MIRDCRHDPGLTVGRALVAIRCSLVRYNGGASSVPKRCGFPSKRFDEHIASIRAEANAPEFGAVLALDNGTDAPRWTEVKPITEEVATFENNGAPLTRNRLELDPAYVAAGFLIPRRNPTQGVVLFSAAASRNGDLYLYLSSVPIARPTPGAVIDPRRGACGELCRSPCQFRLSASISITREDLCTLPCKHWVTGWSSLTLASAFELFIRTSSSG
jgi:hypothetical protein